MPKKSELAGNPKGDSNKNLKGNKVDTKKQKDVESAKKKRASANKDSLSKKRIKGSSINSKTRGLNIDAVITEEIAPSHLINRKENTKLKSSKTDSRKADIKKQSQISNISSIQSGFGIEIENQDLDALDLIAINLIDILKDGVYQLANLTKFELSTLYRYFYRTNPIISRIINLHTDLPLSKLRLQAPQGVPEIIKDYIMTFFEKVLKKINFPEVFREIVQNYNIHGDCTVVMDDYFKELPRELQDMDELSSKISELDDKTVNFLNQIEKNYEKNPSDVNLVERMSYLEKKFLGFFMKTYKGPDKCYVVPFYLINSAIYNSDIDYRGIKIDSSELLSDLIKEGTDTEVLEEMGYTKGYLSLRDSEESDENEIYIDNDYLEGIPYIFNISSFENESRIHSILNEAIEWDLAKRSFKIKISMLGKLGRTVTAPDLSSDQVADLKTEVDMMLEDPNHVIVANYPIEWEENNAFVKEELNELIESTEALKEIIALGMGMPISLISGDSQYSGDNIKLEVLNTEYMSFKLRMQEIIEEKVFKPIALRKGFISVDSWGDTVLIYPKLTFSRMSIRDDNVFDLLFSLYQKGSLPVGIIYEVLNIDPDDVKRSIREDLFTVFDPNFNEILRDLYSNSADQLFNKTDIVGKLINETGLPLREEVSPEGDQDEFS